MIGILETFNHAFIIYFCYFLNVFFDLIFVFNIIYLIFCFLKYFTLDPDTDFPS